jgi:hypothetical protein
MVLQGELAWLLLADMQHSTSPILQGIGVLSFLTWSIVLASVFDHGALGPLVGIFSTAGIFT